MKQIIKLNGTQIKTPDVFKVQKYDITKAGRVTSGLMKMDFIAKKRKLILHYNALSAEALDEILNIVDTTTMFFKVSYIENNKEKTITCYNGDLEQMLHRTGNRWWWQHVEFHFIEQ